MLLERAPNTMHNKCKLMFPRRSKPCANTACAHLRTRAHKHACRRKRAFTHVCALACALTRASARMHTRRKCAAILMLGRLIDCIQSNHRRTRHTRSPPCSKFLTECFIRLAVLELDRVILMGAPEAFKSTLGGQGPIYAQITFGSLPVCFRFLDGPSQKYTRVIIHKPMF